MDKKHFCTNNYKCSKHFHALFRIIPSTFSIEKYKKDGFFYNTINYFLFS
ncbi:hypothetical protein WCP94_002969 [Bilophila wadsworthia]